MLFTTIFLAAIAPLMALAANYGTYSVWTSTDCSGTATSGPLTSYANTLPDGFYSFEFTTSPGAIG